MRILLVGGAVRNLLLNKPIKDRDYVFFGTPDEFLKKYPTARRDGKSFSVFRVENVEYAQARGETIERDLAARDLTVNALALDDDGTLYAHPKALSDLKRKILRPASEGSMRDDPLRVFRAARFLASYPEFEPHPELIDSMRRASADKLLDPLIPERIGQELIKALDSPAPGRFLTLLDQTGCLSPWFRELEGCSLIPAGPTPYHDSHVLSHTVQVMDKLAGDRTAVHMGLCHDLGKCSTPAEILPHHYGHESRGEGMALAMGKRLKLPEKLIRAGAEAARLHMKAGRYDELRPGTRVDLLVRAHVKGLLAPLFALARADGGGNHIDQAARDLEAVLSVKLKPEDRNKGGQSGRKLRELRCMALAREAGNTSSEPDQSARSGQI